MVLGSIKQYLAKDTITFIKRYQDLALECKETIPEADLLYDCITNMNGSLMLFLEHVKIPTFMKLIERAKKTMSSMQKANKRQRGLQEEGLPFMQVTNVEERKSQAFDQQSTRRKYNRVPPPTNYGPNGGFPLFQRKKTPFICR